MSKIGGLGKIWGPIRAPWPQRRTATGAMPWRVQSSEILLPLAYRAVCMELIAKVNTEYYCQHVLGNGLLPNKMPALHVDPAAGRRAGTHCQENPDVGYLLRESIMSCSLSPQGGRTAGQNNSRLRCMRCLSSFNRQCRPTAGDNSLQVFNRAALLGDHHDITE